jgi:hypothetical protein
LDTAAGMEVFEIAPPEHVQQPLIQTIVDELLGKGKCPSTGVSAARTSHVMEDILGEWRVWASQGEAMRADSGQELVAQNGN